MAKIFKYKDKDGEVLVLRNHSDRVLYKRFQLREVPDFPDDIPAARAWMVEQTLLHSDGDVGREEHINKSRLQREDKEIDSVIASCIRQERLPHLGQMTAEEVVAYVETEVNGMKAIKEYLKEVSAAIVLLRDCID